MNEVTTQQFKLNEQGDVDIEFYIDKGHLMRAQQMVEYKQELKAWLRSHLHLNELKFMFTRLVHH